MSNNPPKKREFSFNGRLLDDPDPNMPVEKVLEFHAILHTELTNAGVKGPTITAGGVAQYKFEVRLGDKG